MLGMVMTRLVAELVYENNNWALRLQGEDPQPLIVDPLIARQQLSEAETQQLVINLGRAPRIDSTGLKFLLNLYQGCSGAQLILHNPNHHLERILQIMQLNRLFLIEHEDRE